MEPIPSPEVGAGADAGLQCLRSQTWPAALVIRLDGYVFHSRPVALPSIAFNGLRAGALRILDDYGVEELSPRDYGSWRPSKQSVSRLPSTPIHLNEPVSGSPQLMMLA